MEATDLRFLHEFCSVALIKLPVSQTLHASPAGYGCLSVDKRVKIRLVLPNHIYTSFSPYQIYFCDGGWVLLILLAMWLFCRVVGSFPNVGRQKGLWGVTAGTRMMAVMVKQAHERTNDNYAIDWRILTVVFLHFS